MVFVPLQNQAEHVRFAVAFALRGFKIASQKHKLTEAERYEIGDRVAAYIEKAGWQVLYDRRPMHSTGGMGTGSEKA